MTAPGAPTSSSARCQNCGRHSSLWRSGRGRSAYCEQCRDTPPTPRTPAAAAATPSQLHPVVAAWRHADISRIAYESGGSVELREIGGSRIGETKVAFFPTVAAAVLAIKNQRIQWRVLGDREPLSKGDDLGCLSVVTFAVG
ncbi:MAG: hypothetical protein WDO74_37425 [Pseudomonadota bacterium]